MNYGSIKITKLIVRVLFLSFFILGLEGCFSNPSAVIIPKNADHGPYPKNYKENIKSYLDKTLNRPYSTIIYETTEPEKAFSTNKKQNWFTGRMVYARGPGVPGWSSRVCYSALGLHSDAAYRCDNLFIRNDRVIGESVFNKGCLTEREVYWWMKDVKKGRDRTTRSPYEWHQGCRCPTNLCY
jgi:hypothetical protein